MNQVALTGTVAKVNGGTAKNGRVSAAAQQKASPVPEENPAFGEDAEAVEPEDAELPF